MRCAGYVFALLYAVTAPLVLLLMAFTLVGSVIARRLFGHDPAAVLAEQHPAAWATVKLTGRCTLGLLVAATLLGQLM